MISLSIATMEKMSEDRLRSLEFFNRGKWDKIDSYSRPVWVGFDIIKFFDEYYKVPHYLIPESANQGDKIHTICRECFAETMYDAKHNTFYCPRCES